MILLGVPLVAVGVATASQAAGQIRVASRAQAVQRLVSDIGKVDRVRRAAQAERVPNVALLLAQRLMAEGVPQTARPVVELDVIARTLGGLRPIVDAAFEKAIASVSHASAVAQLRAIYRQTTKLRANQPEPASYARWATVLTDLDGIETSLVARADAGGVGPSTTRALNDVAAVSRAAQYGGQLIPSLMSTFLPASRAQLVETRGEFATIWGGYESSSSGVLTTAAEPVRKAWAAAADTSASRTVDQVMRDAVSDPATANLADLREAGPAAQTRQRLFNAVLVQSLDRADRAAAQQRSAAQRALALIVTLDALLLLLTFGLALLVRSWVTRSLSKLAAQAKQMSEGELADVEVTGPKEVRTVARALGEAVVTLRGVQAQAAAMAAGTVDAKALETALPGPLGKVVHASVVRVFDAMRSQELAQQELAHRAAHDPLTDMPNRGYAVELLNRSLHRAQRTGSMTGLMFVDLDHFKAVNDTFGHAAGDFTLQTASKRMTEVVRDGDMVARLGGDEFVVLLEDVTSESDFVQLGERLVEVLREPITFDGRELRVGASIGVAICRDGHADGDRLMREADAAVYRAKASGRGRVGIFDDNLRRELAEHADLEAALFAALTNDEFVVYYQPVVDIGTGAATGLEALIRWNRPGLGMVPPQQFIPVAESSTLINDIGRLVLDQATRQLAEWTERYPAAAHLTMAVNISGRHLSSPQLVDDVSNALARSGVQADRLIIELTETMLVDDVRCAANMDMLRQLGVRIALDDFGTGYTSIGQLPRLPIDILKIDRSFVATDDPSRLELCKLMVSAARAFGLNVIAEGVETESQADSLRHMHVQSCQGFLYATPQPAEALDPKQLVKADRHPTSASVR